MVFANLLIIGEVKFVVILGAMMLIALLCSDRLKIMITILSICVIAVVMYTVEDGYQKANPTEDNKKEITISKAEK